MHHITKPRSSTKVKTAEQSEAAEIRQDTRPFRFRTYTAEQSMGN